MQENTITKTINVELATWRDLMRIKAELNAYDFDEVVKKLVHVWDKPRLMDKTWEDISKLGAHLGISLDETIKETITCLKKERKIRD